MLGVKLRDKITNAVGSADVLLREARYFLIPIWMTLDLVDEEGDVVVIVDGGAEIAKAEDALGDTANKIGDRLVSVLELDVMELLAQRHTDTVGTRTIQTVKCIPCALRIAITVIDEVAVGSSDVVDDDEHRLACKLIELRVGERFFLIGPTLHRRAGGELGLIVGQHELEETFGAKELLDTLSPSWVVEGALEEGSVYLVAHNLLRLGTSR
jgi:hypothetical protein